jgi:S1-C subfamily serine protease
MKHFLSYFAVFVAALAIATGVRIFFRQAAPPPPDAPQSAKPADPLPSTRGFLGMDFITIEGDPTNEFKGTPGVLVIGVLPGGPAEKSGIGNGQRVLKANGTMITGREQLLEFCSTRKPNETVELLIAGQVDGNIVERLVSVQLIDAETVDRLNKEFLAKQSKP